MPKATTELGTEQGVKTTVHTENGDGTFHITKEQNIQPTLDYAKNLRDISVDRNHHSRKVAEIPPVLAAKLYRDGILGPNGDTKALLKWLDQPENKPFKTWEGHLS